MASSNGHRIGCLVADGHTALRRGLAALLAEQGDVEIVGQAGDGAAAIALAERRAPDVAVVDAALEADGAPCWEALARGERTAVVVYAAQADRGLVETALEAGVDGVVLKTAPSEDLVRAVRAVAQGDPYVDATLTRVLLERRAAGDVLSGREREVLQLLANGDTTARAATGLFLSPATVRSYVEQAMAKLQAHNRTHAVALAVRRGLID